MKLTTRTTRKFLERTASDERKMETQERMHAGFIYFIQCNGDDGPIKIGKAKFIDKRFSELQIGCPYEFDLLAHARFADASLAEGMLHDAFREHWIRGEWFRCHDHILSAAREVDAIRFAAIAEMAKAFKPRASAISVEPKPAVHRADDWLTTFRAHRAKQRASGRDPARRRRKRTT